MGAQTNTSSKKWQVYYQKTSPIVRLIELINETYFSKYFEHIFKKIVGTNIRELKVLEPGCGSGIMSARLAKQKAKVYLLDLSSNALQTSLANFIKIKTTISRAVNGDIFSMPFKTNSFDIVWNQGVIEHFRDRKKVVKEMFRVVKPNGKIILFVPSYLSVLHLIYLAFSGLNIKKLWPFDEQDFLKKEELLDILKAAGAKNIKVKRLKGSLLLSSVAYGQK